MKNSDSLKMNLEQSFDQIRVPESLFRFADELPERFDRGEISAAAQVITKRRVQRRYMPMVMKSTAVAAFMVIAFTAGVQMSPAFASLVKGVPGFELAVDWLTDVREKDGVQKAINHGYSPIEAVTKQIGGTTITISDIYLTEEELLFKTFIQSKDYDVTDRSGQVSLFVGPRNLRGGGSATSSSLITTTDDGKSPVLQETYKYQLEEGALEDFLDKNSLLILGVRKHVSNRDVRQSNIEEIGDITLSVDHSKLLYNKVFEPAQTLAIDDPDWAGLTLEKLTIQPTTMNVILEGNKGWDWRFSREEDGAPYLKDEKGNIYRYDPSGPGLNLPEGKQQLPFSSSVFFDADVKKLYLHIGEMTVTERAPSGSFELSMKGPFPQTVHFNHKDIVIEGAEYHEEEYLLLKIRKEDAAQTKLEGIDFNFVQDRDKEKIEQINKLREALNIPGFGMARNFKNKPYLSVYIPAPEQDKYTISLHRANDRIVVNKEYPIELKP